MFKKLLFLNLSFAFIVFAGDWTADLQFTPNPSPYVSDWESNPGIITFTLTYTGQNSVNIHLYANLSRNGQSIANGESDPISFNGPGSKVFSNTNILNWSNVSYSSTLEEQILRSGRFPDGNYNLCVMVVDESTSDTVARDCKSYQILLPSPPELLSPANSDSTSLPFPVFVWTPILAPPGYTVTYRLTLWEVHHGQTPLQASFGIPFFVDSTENIPTLVYPVDATQLENGKTYVWQVQALDQAHQPFGQNDGKSQLFTFTFVNNTFPLPSLGDTLEVVENAVYLIISDLNSEDLGDRYRLNGSSTLLLPVFPGASPIEVSVNNLTVLKNDLSIVDGTFSASNLSNGIIPQEFTGPFIKVSSISYNVQNGVSVGIRFSFPESFGLPEFNFPDGLSIVRNGFHGRLEKEANPGETLFTLGSGQTRLDVSSLNIHFSSPVVSLSGKMHVLDTAFSYTLDSLTLSGDELSGKLKADGPVSFPMVPNENFIVLTADSVRGNFSTGNYVFNVFGRINLNFPEDSCGAGIEFQVMNNRVELRNFTPSCELPDVDLGWVKVEFRNLSLPELSFATGEEGWNFDFNLDAKFSFPAFDSIQFPWINGVSIFKGGFRFPHFTFSSDNMPSLPSFNFGGYQLKVLQFSMPDLTLPSFNWPSFGNDSTGFDFGFNFEFSMPDLPTSFPDCIRLSRFTLDDIHLRNGEMTFSLPEGMVHNCRLPLGGGVEYVINNLGGSFTASYNNGLNIDGGIDLRGSLVLPEAFNCNRGRELDLGTHTLHFSYDGIITGRVDNVIPSCPLTYGPLTIKIDSSGFEFVNDSGTQRVNMLLHGIVKLPAPTEGDSVMASGYLGFELTEFRFIDGFVRIDEPFIWKIPSGDPVLSIRVDSAILDTAGFHVDGNGVLQLSENYTVGVNFNRLVLDLSDFSVKSGSADFTSSFAFKIDLTGGEKWSAVRSGSSLTGEGIMLNLPENISLAGNGLAVRDTSLVNIKWSGSEYTVVARFSDDFLLSWSPTFGVGQGKVDFIFNGNRVAWLDTAGFHPDFEGIVPIPSKLAIPDTSIAYVELKRNDSLLVHYTYIGDTLRIYTEASKPVRIYIPALKYNNFVPNIGVEFDVKVNPTSFEFLDGEIHARPPEGIDTLFTLSGLGIPLDVMSFDYINDNGEYGALLSGKFALPSALDSLEIRFDSLRITNSGLSGTARVGHVYDSLGHQEYIDSVNFGNFVTFKINGGEIAFSPLSAKFSGDIYPDLFARDGRQYPIHFVASYGNSGFDFSFDLPDTLPVSFAEFMPMDLGGNPPLSMSLGDTISLEFSGIFSFPFLDDSFRISLSGLKVMSVAPYVVAPEIRYPDPGQFFQLFGLEFGLKDVRKNGQDFPALGFEYSGGVFKVNMSGAFAFMDDTISFTGMEVGTDGSFQFEEVNLLSSPINIIDKYWTLDTVKFTMDSLRFAGTVKLPEPFDSAGPQRYHVTIGYDGSISGGGKIVLIDETPGMGGNDLTEFDFFVGSLDINYLALNIDFEHPDRSDIQAVFYMYFDADHPIKIGYNEADSLAPGFTINMNGDYEWGEITIPNGSIPDIDWDVFKLSISNVTLLDEEGFGISFSGNMTLKISSVSGSIGFEGFKVHSNGDVDFPSIDSADLSIAEVVTISVSSINYIDHDTTISIPTVAMPTQNTSGSSSKKDVEVSSSFSFGLTLNIMDYGGGGVKNFIVYTKKSDGAFGLVIDSANMTIPSVFEASFDMEYEGGEYFRFLFAGDAKIPAANNMQVTVVGKVANLPSGPSFGAFIAVSTEIDIIPRLIILSGVGGGFFYNPEESDFRLVKQKSGLTGMPFDTMSVRNADFAIFLYAQARVVSDWVAEGKALLTVTDQEFLLDARLVLLHQDDRITGYAHLGIGFQDFYAVGNMGVNMKISSLITGNGTFAFYVYGEDAWGVMGGVDVELLSLLDINGEFFVGPPGFMVSGSASYGFDIWVISINSGFEGQIWYVRDASWGAYYKAYIKAEVLGGAVSAKGWLEACLIGSPSFYLYGVAGLSVHTWVYDWDGSVWAKISSDGVDGGFGRDPEMEALIDEARQTADDMNDAKNEAQQAIEDAEVAQSMLSQQEQAIIFYKVFTKQYRINGVDLYRFLMNVEIDNGGLENGNEYAAIEWVANNVYGGEGSPYGDTLAIARKRRIFENQLENVGRYTAQVNAILSRLNVIVDSIQQTGLTTIGESPVERLELGDGYLNVTVRDGHASVSSQPVFGINNSQNQANSQNASEFERSVRETYAQVISRMNEIEIALFNIQSLTSRDDIDSLLKAYTRLDMANSSYLSYSKQYVGNFIKWERLKRHQIGSVSDNIHAAIRHKTQRLHDSQVKQNLLIGRKRVELIILYDGDTHSVDTALASFRSRIEGFSQEQINSLIDSLGAELWYNIPVNGLAYMDSLFYAYSDSIDAKFVNSADSVRVPHKNVTAAFDDIYGVTVELGEVLYDLYDRFLFWLSGGSSPYPPDVHVGGGFNPAGGVLINPHQIGNGPVQQQDSLQVRRYVFNPRVTGSVGGHILRNGVTMTVRRIQIQLPNLSNYEDGINTFLARIDTLGKLLTPPRITSVSVTTTNRGFYNELDIRWNITHPLGNRAIREVSYLYSHPHIPYWKVGYQSMGKPGPLSRTIQSPNRLKLEFHQFDNEQRLTGKVIIRARAGLGLTSFREVNFVALYGDNQRGQHNTYVSSRDTTPPLIPVVRFPRYHRKLLTPSTYSQEFYTSATSELYAEWWSHDYETDVAEYQYMVERSYMRPLMNPFAQTITWVEVRDTILGWTSAQGRTRATIRGLSLKHDSVYVLSVRARNADGYWSEPGFKYVKIDTTPPPAPSGRYAITYNIMQPNFFNVYIPPRLSAKVNVNNDPESGIASLLFKADTIPHYRYEGEGWDDVPGYLDSVAVEGAPLTYLDTFYISIVEVNNAGLVSDSAYVTEPMMPNDPTPPQNLAFTVGPLKGQNFIVAIDTLRVNLIRPAEDKETGVKSYYFGAGFSRRDASLIPFRKVDSTKVKGNRFSLNPDFSRVPDGSAIYFLMRAENYEGDMSAISYFGPIHIEKSPPPAVNISRVNYIVPERLHRPYLDVIFYLSDDPQTHTRMAYYRILEFSNRRRTASVIVDWTPFSTLNMGTNHTKIYLNRTLRTSNTHVLEIKTVNRVGLTSVSRFRFIGGK